MPNPSRRRFLGTTLALGSTAFASAAMASSTALSYSRIRGSNERLRVGVIGLNGRGQSHMSGFQNGLAALCDCDSDVLGKAAEGRDVATYADFRKMCESPELDVISIATPNHTHSLIAMTALANGKHVYVEKPVSHNVREGRLLAEAAERSGLVCQAGTQARSSRCLQEAVQFVRDGGLGTLQYAIGTCYKPRMSIGKLDGPLSIPNALDYDLWCGPAEKRSLFRPRLHYDWHWDFNTGNGDMGNQGIHQMDIARWFLGHATVSPRVLSIGGRVGYDDAGDTPNSQTVLHDYPGAPIIFETRGLPSRKEFQERSQWGRNMDRYRGSGIGVIVQGEAGHILIGNYSNIAAYDRDGNEIKRWEGEGSHFGNFLDAVEAHDSKLLNAPIVEGHLSSALCHTGGVSHVLGRRRSGSEIREAVSGESSLFQDSVDRLLEHLRANGIATDDGRPLTLGADLRFDTETEQPVDHDEAAALMTRDYRSGYALPSI